MCGTRRTVGYRGVICLVLQYRATPAVVGVRVGNAIARTIVVRWRSHVFGSLPDVFGEDIGDLQQRGVHSAAHVF